MNICENLTREEWQEVMSLEIVRDGWGLDETVTPEDFAEMAYGTKFAKYMTDGPGYAGPLYLIEGGDLQLPLRIIRIAGQMSVIRDLY